MCPLQNTGVANVTAVRGDEASGAPPLPVGLAVPSESWSPHLSAIRPEQGPPRWSIVVFRNCLGSGDQAVRRCQTCQNFDIGLDSLQNCEK